MNVSVCVAVVPKVGISGKMFKIFWRMNYGLKLIVVSG